jgi:hypothetical protein
LCAISDKSRLSHLARESFLYARSDIDALSPTADPVDHSDDYRNKVMVGPTALQPAPKDDRQSALLRAAFLTGQGRNDRQATALPSA